MTRAGEGAGGRGRPTLEIGRLRLHLPGRPGLDSSGLARMVGEALAAGLGPAGRGRERLELRGLRAPAGLGERELAALISRAIVAELEGGERG